MADQQPPDMGSHADTIYSPSPVRSSPAILKMDFKAWHKVRKQWVRKFQWLHEIEKLVAKLRFKNGRTLRYLSLPGRDMIDVRCVHRWCQEKELYLKFLGYNDPEDPADPSDSELNLSVAELTQRNYVDRDSQVVADKFEALSDSASIAYKRMAEAGPFDVINIDLCNSVAGHIPLEKQEDYYKAIYKLVEFQKENRTEPWLLFITTKADQKTVKPAASWLLFECIKNNAESYDSFRRQLLSDLNFQYQAVTKPSSGDIPYRGMKYVGLVKSIFL